MLLSLGNFRFSVDTAAYDELNIKSEYPWAKVDRLGNTPQLQAVGREHRTMSLKGVIFTTYRGGVEQLDKLRAMAGKMEPLELVAGDGRAHGRWCVMNVDQTNSHLFRDGVPQRQAFSLELERFDA